MPHIIKVVTPPHPPNGFVNEFVEYVREVHRGNIYLVREQLAAQVHDNKAWAEFSAKIVAEELPLRTVSVVPLGEQG